MAIKEIRINSEQIVAALWMMNWPENLWATATAVAMAESSGKLTAINSKSGARGLFQILPSAHPDMIPNPQNTSWVSSTTNAKWALQIYKDAGNSWRPWEAYTTGAHAMYLPQAQVAVASWKRRIKGKSLQQQVDIMHKLYGKKWQQMLDTAGVSQSKDRWDQKYLRPWTDPIVEAVGGAADAGADVAGDAVDAVTPDGVKAIGELGVGAAKWMSDASNWLRVAYAVLGGALVIGGLVIVARPMIQSATPVGAALKKVSGKGK